MAQPGNIAYDPMVYGSPTPDDMTYAEMAYGPGTPLPPYEMMLQRYDELISLPMSDEEVHFLGKTLIEESLYNPGYRFRIEATRALEEIDNFIKSKFCPEHIRKYFDGQAGQQRRLVVARRNVRLLWERLGVWNPAWGIPGRPDEFPEDNTWTWRWTWQTSATTKWWRECEPKPDYEEDDQRPDGMVLNKKHPAFVAVQMRKDMRLGEFGRSVAQKKLEKGVSTSKGELFITTRPWFQYTLERAEYDIRVGRAYWEVHCHYNGYAGDLAPSPGTEDRVTKMWKQRGEWKAAWDFQIADILETTVPAMESIVGWMWPGEEELEDLTPDKLGGFTGAESLALSSITYILDKVPTIRELSEIEWAGEPNDDEFVLMTRENWVENWLIHLADPKDMKKPGSPPDMPDDVADLSKLAEITLNHAHLVPAPRSVRRVREENERFFEPGEDAPVNERDVLPPLDNRAIDRWQEFQMMRQHAEAMVLVDSVMGPAPQGPMGVLRRFVEAQEPVPLALGPWALPMESRQATRERGRVLDGRKADEEEMDEGGEAKRGGKGKEKA
jgi:hypothetical protein